MEENNVQDQNSNGSEEVVLETTEETTTQEVDIEEIKAKLAKAEELNQNYKIRAEKAERAAKASPVHKTEQTKVEMSTSDVFALVKANIAEEDIKDVQEYAKFKGISVSEALKSNVIKTLLSDKEENRKTASVSNVSNVKRGVQKVSVETLLSRARKGDMPESQDDLAALIAAHRARK